MTDFSLEAAAERIVDRRTKAYFAEVWSSYAHGNYRSATVMLWSVVVADMLFKLEEIKSIYADPTAEGILKEIQDYKNTNPKSPEWEWHLVDKIKNRTHLLEPGDYVNLQSLVSHRHLCAHPILSATDALFAPSKEQCRAHIRNSLDGMLTKPPILTKKVFAALLEDVEQKQAVLPDDESLERYLGAKYFKGLTVPVENSLVRSLWRIVFKTTDQRCEQNRSINYRTFRLFYRRRPGEVNALIQADAAYFSELTLAGSPFGYLLAFLSSHPAVFSLLSEAAKAPIEAHANGNIDAFLNAWFLSADMQSHVTEVARRVDDGATPTSVEAFHDFLAVAKADGYAQLACGIGITIYGRSSNYNAADAACEGFVLPYLDEYDAATMTRLLEAIEGNGQTYGRRGAGRRPSANKDSCRYSLWGWLGREQIREFLFQA